MPGDTLNSPNALNALNALNSLDAPNASMPGLDALARLSGWSRQPICPATRLVLGNLFARLTFYPAFFGWPDLSNFRCFPIALIS